MKTYNYDDFRFVLGPVKIFDGKNVYTMARGFNIAKPEVFSKPAFISIKDRAGRKPNIAEETFMISTLLQNENKSGPCHYVNEADIVRYEKRGSDPKVGLVIYNRQKYMWQLIDAITERAYPLYDVVISAVYGSYFEHPEYMGYTAAQIENELEIKSGIKLNGETSGKKSANSPAPVARSLPKPVPISPNNSQARETNPTAAKEEESTNVDAAGENKDCVRVYVDYKTNEGRPATWAYRLVNANGQVYTRTNEFNYEGNDYYYIICSTIMALSKLTKKNDILLFTRDKKFNTLLNSNLIDSWVKNGWKKKDNSKPNNVQELKALHNELSRLGCRLKAEYASAKELNLFAN